MNYTGLIVGAMSFIIIGIFHPIVIKCEYYFTEKVWPVFLVGGLAVCALSVFIKDQTLSAVLAVLGFSMLWSIGELKHQTKRVEKGWFPKNPKREQKRITVRPTNKSKAYIRILIAPPANAGGVFCLIM